MIICVLDNFDLTHLSIVTWIHVRECNCMFHSSLLSFHLFPSHSHCMSIILRSIFYFWLFLLHFSSSFPHSLYICLLSSSLFWYIISSLLQVAVKIDIHNSVSSSVVVLFVKRKFSKKIVAGHVDNKKLFYYSHITITHWTKLINTV